MYDMCVLCLHLRKVPATRSVNTAGSASDSLLAAAGPCNDYESLVTISALKEEVNAMKVLQDQKDMQARSERLSKCNSVGGAPWVVQECIHRELESLESPTLLTLLS